MLELINISSKLVHNLRMVAKGIQRSVSVDMVNKHDAEMEENAEGDNMGMGVGSVNHKRGAVKGWSAEKVTFSSRVLSTEAS